MHAQWRGATLRGLEAVAVRVEVQMGRGLPGIGLVGLAGAATRESRERVLGAMRECGFSLPAGRVTVNLAPAEEPKEGAAFDLAIALGILEVLGQLRVRRGRDWWLLGELALDGSLRPVRGALALGLAASRAGARGLIYPPGNAPEMARLDGVPRGSFEHLRQVLAWVEGRGPGPRPPGEATAESRPRPRAALALEELSGLPRLKRALEVAAAGEHHLLLLGAPGDGKTLLARVLADLLPPLEDEEEREVSALRSLAGLPLREGRRRPFRSPHHSLSLAGLLGSGGKGGRPGELSLAHRGLLFLDELPEFNRAVLEALREPLEEGSYVLSRGAGSLRWPARFQLAAAMNPCPCGQRLRGSEHCRCTPGQRRRYFGRISGPLLDRVDLVLHVPRRRRLREAEGRPGEAVRRVATARRRLRESPPALPPGEQRWLDEQLERLFSSFRLRFKIRKLARSLAALDGSERVTRPQMLEALDLGLESRLEILTEMGEGEPP